MKDFLNIEGSIIPYEAKQDGRRKRITMSIKEGMLWVYTPNAVSAHKLKKLIISQKDWILKHLKASITDGSEENFREWDNKAVVLYLGEKHKVIIQEYSGKNTNILFKNNCYEIYVSRKLDTEQRKNAIEEALKRWYMKEAASIIAQRVEYYAQKFGLTYNNIRIKEQATRWGSCSQKKNLNFNWKLIMAPVWVLDYVIVHELCHLKHLNHSEDFWNMVEMSYFDYKKAREWLKINGKTLRI